MAAKTLTYSAALGGWTSFFSFLPEWMIGLNNNFYTIKGGHLWRHRDSTVDRNNFYGVSNSSSITTIFNDSPLDAKMFKTLGLEGSAPWTADIVTDFGDGTIAASQYKLKEGDYYGYIRRDLGNEDVDLMSAQGIGVAISTTGGTPLTLGFSFDIGSGVNIGDIAYVGGASSITKIGTITTITATSIEIAAPLIIPALSDFIMYLKDSEAESFGSRGYYMEVLLTNADITAVELFAVTSEVFKSYP